MASGEPRIIASIPCCHNLTRCSKLGLKRVYESVLRHNIIDKSHKRVGSSHCWLAASSYKLPHPLRSDVVTTSSSLLRDDPSPSCASILSPFMVDTYRVFSWHHMKSSHVPQKSPDQARANCTPDAAQPVSRCLLS